ncbi:bifunctional 2-polyprenyl-6-hydroxyphenol methylase/3-demethylubiquinol 3-O-methyltransferase UbiG [Pontibacter sp. SGAir0037]|uniref:class I SAM-dependent methyltransferase n=1 Tax=Pontibacter sp. SGAir0037 TaxID=2571030 RepID=UPI0010CD6553|nr:methyltransferase domain-containing protein [Pontibacter sp. SGAir0037]QCR22680.1 SAM-dependent methyltransferase [Pontibacter sp. SGAir0037]
MVKNDPIGAALKDYMQGAAGVQIVVESNITEDDTIPVSYLFREYEAMPELEQLALKECKGVILDIGAGAGCHSLALQRMGLQVTALDISEGAIAAMKERGIQQVLEKNVFDLHDLQFDTLLMLMNGIGIAGDLYGLTRFLKHARTLLRAGGQILLESSDILYMFEEEDGSVLLDLNAGYYGEVVYNMRYKEHETGSFKWLFIDAAILQDYAEEQGFGFRLLYEGEFGNYLAQLTLIN